MKFKILETLDYYQVPLVTLEKDKFNRKWVSIIIFWTDNSEDWMYYRLEEKDLEKFDKMKWYYDSVEKRYFNWDFYSTHRKRFRCYRIYYLKGKTFFIRKNCKKFLKKLQ